MFTLKAINNNSIKTTDLLGAEVFFTSFERSWLTKDLTRFKEDSDIAKVYPSVMKCHIRSEEASSKTYLGSFIKGRTKSTIRYANRSTAENLAVLAHEIQHLLQDLDNRVDGSNFITASKLSRQFCEGLSKDSLELEFLGKNSFYLDDEDLKALSKEQKRKSEVKRSVDMADKFGHIYSANIGEIEARAAQLLLLEFPGWPETKKMGLVKWEQRFENDNKSWYSQDLKESGETQLINNKSLSDLKEIVRDKKEFWERERSLAEGRTHIPEEYYEDNLLEDHFWSTLGDSYRERMNKPRIKKNR